MRRSRLLGDLGIHFAPRQVKVQTYLENLGNGVLQDKLMASLRILAICETSFVTAGVRSSVSHLRGSHVLVHALP